MRTNGEQHGQQQANCTCRASLNPDGRVLIRIAEYHFADRAPYFSSGFVPRGTRISSCPSRNSRFVLRVRNCCFQSAADSFKRCTTDHLSPLRVLTTNLVPAFATGSDGDTIRSCSCSRFGSLSAHESSLLDC